MAKQGRLPPRPGKPNSGSVPQPVVQPQPQSTQPAKPPLTEEALTQLTDIPVTFQAITDFLERFNQPNLFLLRKQTLARIERVTGRPLICYVMQIHNLKQNIPAVVDDGDLTGIGDLVRTTEGDQVDVFLMSNGGVPTTAERIVRLIRDKFREVRFIIPSNAFSAATMICFSGNQIIMDSMSTLGPIDPQVGGVPARTILRAFEELERRVRSEGPMVLATYARLVEKYNLHDLEFCKSAEKLSEELAQTWLSKYMLNCDLEDQRVVSIVDYFKSFDIQKSHGRSIDRRKARELGLNVVNVEDIEGLDGLVRSLFNQYELWFDRTPFYKMFENARGINWGRQAAQVSVQLPLNIPGLPSA